MVANSRMSLKKEKEKKEKEKGSQPSEECASAEQVPSFGALAKHPKISSNLSDISQ